MYVVRPKTNDVGSFFEEFGGTLFNTNGSHDLSVDGTGRLPSVDAAAGVGIRDYIKTLFSVGDSGRLNVLDLGAGVGHLQKVLDEDRFFNAYSFEGSLELLDKVVCSKKRVSICHLSHAIQDERLCKAFHLTTSFEFLEHCHRSHQDVVWTNIRYLSDFHLCSIHVANREHKEHCTIMKPSEWEEFFERKNIWYQRLGDYPINSDRARETFREATGLYGWDCSVMYLLRFGQ